MSGEKILIVDDRRENIVFLANDILRPEGFDVITAMNGERGLQKALEEEPDLIITDMEMPKMTGDDMIRALREAGRAVPVILTTFHGSERAAVRAFRAGATDYLIKPFTVDEIFEAVERALSLRPEPPVQESPTQELLERRLAELSTLHDIGKAVASLLDLEQILARTVQAAVYLLNAEEGHVMLEEPSTGELYLRAAYSQREKQARSVRIRVGDSLTRQVLDTGKPFILKPPSSGDAEHKLKTGHLTKSMLAVPIRWATEVVGVLLVDNIVRRIEFSEGDCRKLSVLAEYTAIAVTNARLYRQASDRAGIASEEVARLAKLDVTDCQAKVARLAEQLRALADEAERLGQQLQTVGRPPSGEPPD